MPAALVFVDGVGIGARDPSRNPLARRDTLLSQFDDGTGCPLPHAGVVSAIDVSLGVPGRPQSATGHTALLTGENAPALLGRHLLGYPNTALKAVLAQRSIFQRLRDAGRSFEFANGYPTFFLDALALPHRGPADAVEIPPRLKRRMRAAAAPFAFGAAGGLLHTFEEVAAGKALSHDLTGALARGRGLSLPSRTPQEAAAIFAQLAAESDFAMFDFFRTDDAGHARDFATADAILEDLDAFLRTLLELLPLQTQSLFVVSDHGNLEDLSTRSHTLAKVALLRFGPARKRATPDRLDQILPLMLAEAGAT